MTTNCPLIRQASKSNKTRFTKDIKSNKTKYLTQRKRSILCVVMSFYGLRTLFGDISTYHLYLNVLKIIPVGDSNWDFPQHLLTYLQNTQLNYLF
jgi:hypothetical protein